MDTSFAEQKVALAYAMRGALQDDRLDDAEVLLRQLSDSCGLPPEDPALLAFYVTIAIQRGRVRDALLALNNMDEQTCPELRAVCMYITGDPLWHGIATSVEETTQDDKVRLAMRQLLGKAGYEQ